MEIFNSCTIRKYVLTDYVLSESVKYVSQCDLILDQSFVRVNRNYVLTEYVLNENDCSFSRSLQQCWPLRLGRARLAEHVT